MARYRMLPTGYATSRTGAGTSEGRQCQTTNLPPRVIGALRENVWRSHTHFRTGKGGPSCYRWRKSGNGCRTSMRPATRPYFSRLRASDQPCNSNSRVSPRTTRRNRPPQALARFDPLDPQWPLLNLAVARFGIALVRFPTDSCGNFVPYIFTSPTKLVAPGG